MKWEAPTPATFNKTHTQRRTKDCCGENAKKLTSRGVRLATPADCACLPVSCRLCAKCYTQLTEGSMLTSKPRLPHLQYHKLWI